MRRRSFTGPVVLLIIGALFLWRNLHPEAPIFETVALYWPFLLIGWGFLRLIEVLFWSRKGYRVGLSGGEVALIVIICLVGSAAWQARVHGARFNFLGSNIWAQQFDYPVSARASAAGVKRIILENPRGNVKLTGGDVQEIEVSGRKVIRAWARREADRANDATPVDLVPEGDHIVIRTNQDRVRENMRISDDLEVAVPRGVAVETRMGSGDYEIAEVDGNVDLSIERGDVRLSRVGGAARLSVSRSDLIRATDLKGNLELRGEGSDIDLENIAGQVTITGGYRGTLDFKNLAKPLQVDFEGARTTELRAQAVPGSISMDLAGVTGKDIVGPIRLIARSRDIRLEGFTNSLELETERGDVELTPRKTPLPSIDVRSGSGRIDLALPPKANFTLQATAQTGDTINDFGPPIEKETSGRSATLRGKVGTGPEIRLNATRGWISVRKEGSAPSAPSRPPEPPSPPQPDGGAEL
jgi:DUF4097 and DUF4098 domain-containing protein YvlB